MSNHILSIILFTPLVGALVLLFVPKENKAAIRWIANFFALGGFLISLPLVPMFWAQRLEPGFKFIEGVPNNWIPSIGAGYVIELVQRDGRGLGGVEGVGLDRDVCDEVGRVDHIARKTLALGADENADLVGFCDLVTPLVTRTPKFVESHASAGDQRDLDAWRAARSAAFTSGTANTAPIDARTALGLNGSAVPGPSATQEAPNASALRRIVPTFPGSASPCRYTHSGPAGASSHRSS